MAVRVIKGEAAKREARWTKSGRVVSPSRRAAFAILRRVEEERAYASVLLANATGELRADDRALCYELVLGVLRWQLWLDKLIEHYAGRGAHQIDAPARLALRLGLYQLCFLARIPASAAVNESVNLAHEAHLGGAASFINAVLRRATREPDFDPSTQTSDPVERLAVATSHPRWLIERWSCAFGVDEASALARANNLTPPVAFRVNAWRADEARVIERLRAAGVEAEPSTVAPGAWRVRGAGGAAVRELAREGLIYTQDEASQLVAHVLEPCAGERVLDVCAAPGSKATHLAGLADDKAFVVAGDRHGHRLRILRESAARQGLNSIRMVACDAEGALPFSDNSFDRVLVDAPCTGTGTLRHNPEIRWRITPSDIDELAARQARILAQAARMVRPQSGRLVYSTCSVEPEENESIVEAFLAAHHEFELVHALAPENLLTAQGTARTWPHRDGADGFFVAALARRS